MNGKPVCYVDQHNKAWFATSVAELRGKVSCALGCRAAKIGKMYRGKKDGSTVVCGYVIGSLWLYAFAPLERAP